MTMTVASLLTLREDTGVPIDLGPVSRSNLNQQDRPGLSPLTHGWMIQPDIQPIPLSGQVLNDVGIRTPWWTDEPARFEDRVVQVSPMIVPDPPAIKIWEASDPRYWIGQYEGTADVHHYRDFSRPDSANVID